ncbi:MAG: 5'/3'-nucleotidase SurE [Spirochaetaceae bacterium]|nr:MAG: 5'/3'-nucleotidase SurE [Spirochaetaceae bacterium]
MRILLTNDDGIDSAGLDALRVELSRGSRNADDERNDQAAHEVWIVAPDGERSAQSHSITVHDPIRCRELGSQIFRTSGTPADCVIVGVLGIMTEKPDVVISGINIGPNLGTDIIYSGTVAAARQAAFMGIPGIAVSVNSYRPPFHMAPLARFVARNLQTLVGLWNPRHLVNINGPNIDSDDVPVEITHPSWRVYHDQLEEFQSPNGDRYYFMNGHPIENAMEKGSDWTAVAEGSISVSPIYLNPVDHHEDEKYRQAVFNRAEPDS